MLEGKTANNIVDRYHRIITGDQNQIEMGIIPEGKITITENGTDIDVAQYALADVNVAASVTMGTLNIINNSTDPSSGAVSYVSDNGTWETKSFSASEHSFNIPFSLGKDAYQNTVIKGIVLISSSLATHASSTYTLTSGTAIGRIGKAKISSGSYSLSEMLMLDFSDDGNITNATLTIGAGS